MPTIVKAGGGVSKTKLATANTQAADVKENTKFVDINGDIQNGTMPNRGTITANVGANASYTIPMGYHNGNGRVNGPTLNGDATAGNVLINKTFYSNSDSLESGTMPNRGAIAQVVGVGASYTIPAGYHNGNGTVTSQSPGDFGNASVGVWSGSSSQTISGLVANAWYAFVFDTIYDATISMTGLSNTHTTSRVRYAIQDDGTHDRQQGRVQIITGKADGTSVRATISRESLYDCVYLVMRIG